MIHFITKFLLLVSCTYGLIKSKNDCQTLTLSKPGSDYAGAVSQTVNGIQCQNWQSNSPHPHSYGHHGNHNYCRNDDLASVAPKGVWCFTTSVWTRWDYCHVKG